jgi:hypothetical protein
MQSMHRISVGLYATRVMKSFRAYPGIHAEFALAEEAYAGFSDKQSSSNKSISATIPIRRNHPNHNHRRGESQG